MYPVVIVVKFFFFEREKEMSARVLPTSHKCESPRESASAYTSVSCFRCTELFLMKQFKVPHNARHLHSHKSANCLFVSSGAVSTSCHHLACPTQGPRRPAGDPDRAAEAGGETDKSLLHWNPNGESSTSYMQSLSVRLP